MKTHAKLTYLHIAPRKARLVANLVRGLDLNDALDQLTHTNKGSAPHFKKLINSAAANAEHNSGMIKDNLYISEIRVDEGTPFKRWQPRAFGRAYPILKRTSHLYVALDEKEKGKRQKGFEKKTGILESEDKKKDSKEQKKADTKKKGFLKKRFSKDEKAARDAKVKGRFFRRKSG